MAEELGLQIGQVEHREQVAQEFGNGGADPSILAAAEAILAQSIPGIEGAGVGTGAGAFVPLTEESRQVATLPSSSSPSSPSPFALREDTTFSEPVLSTPNIASIPGAPDPQPSNAGAITLEKLQQAYAQTVHEMSQAIAQEEMYAASGGFTTLPPSAPPPTPLPPLPSFPGTASSPYRRCPCIGVLPGRACPRCNNTKWIKLCPKCDGVGTIRVNVRRGAVDRVDRCGFCMGAGSVGAPVTDVQEAERVAREAQAQQQALMQSAQSIASDPSFVSSSSSSPTPSPAPIRRHAQLPGMRNGGGGGGGKKSKGKHRNRSTATSSGAR